MIVWIHLGLCIGGIVLQWQLKAIGDCVDPSGVAHWRNCIIVTVKGDS